MLLIGGIYGSGEEIAKQAKQNAIKVGDIKLVKIVERTKANLPENVVALESQRIQELKLNLAVVQKPVVNTAKPVINTAKIEQIDKTLDKTSTEILIPKTDAKLFLLPEDKADLEAGRIKALPVDKTQFEKPNALTEPLKLPIISNIAAIFNPTDIDTSLQEEQPKPPTVPSVSPVQPPNLQNIVFSNIASFFKAEEPSNVEEAKNTKETQDPKLVEQEAIDTPTEEATPILSNIASFFGLEPELDTKGTDLQKPSDNSALPSSPPDIIVINPALNSNTNKTPQLKLNQQESALGKEAQDIIQEPKKTSITSSTVAKPIADLSDIASLFDSKTDKMPQLKLNLKESALKKEAQDIIKKAKPEEPKKTSITSSTVAKRTAVLSDIASLFDSKTDKTPQLKLNLKESALKKEARDIIKKDKPEEPKKTSLEGTGAHRDEDKDISSSRDGKMYMSSLGGTAGELASVSPPKLTSPTDIDIKSLALAKKRKARPTPPPPLTEKELSVFTIPITPIKMASMAYSPIDNERLNATLEKLDALVYGDTLEDHLHYINFVEIENPSLKVPKIAGIVVKREKKKLKPEVKKGRYYLILTTQSGGRIWGTSLNYVRGFFKMELGGRTSLVKVEEVASIHGIYYIESNDKTKIIPIRVKFGDNRKLVVSPQLSVKNENSFEYKRIEILFNSIAAVEPVKL